MAVRSQSLQTPPKAPAPTCPRKPSPASGVLAKLSPAQIDKLQTMLNSGWTPDMPTMHAPMEEEEEDDEYIPDGPDDDEPLEYQDDDAEEEDEEEGDDDAKEEEEEGHQRSAQPGRPLLRRRVRHAQAQAGASRPAGLRPCVR